MENCLKGHEKGSECGGPTNADLSATLGDMEFDADKVWAQLLNSNALDILTLKILDDLIFKILDVQQAGGQRGGDTDRQAHGQWAVGWTSAITILHWPIRYQNKMLLKRTNTLEHDQHGSPGTQNKWNLSTEIITFSGPFCLIGFVNVHHLTTIYKPMIHNLKAEWRRTWNYVQDAPSSSLSRLITYITLPYIFNDTSWKKRNLHCGRPQSAAECAIVATLPRSICGCQGAGTM